MMSFSNQGLQEYPAYAHIGHFDKYYEGPFAYSAVPVMHPVEVNPCPAVIYTFYQSLPISTPQNHSLVESKKLFEIRNDSVYEIKSSDCMYGTLPTDLSGQYSTSVESLSRFNESISSSDCSPQDSTLENEDIHPNSYVSSTLSDSFEGERAAQMNNSFGFFGLDGCWYPCLLEDRVGEMNETVYGEKCITSPLPSRVGGSDEKLNPPTKLMMPKSLMPFYNCYQRLDLPSSALGRPHLIPTFPTDGNISLEELWTAHMKLLFRNLPHKWSLYSSHMPKSPDQTWHTFRDLAKVRFYCQRCMDGWTSMFGVVVFFFSWNLGTSCGDIRYQVSGQKCGRCSSDRFELPLWYPEEAQKVITNLYYEIASRIYGLRTPQHIRTRRLGQPVNHHNKALCQGCAHGLCKQDPQQEVSDPPSDKDCTSAGMSTPSNSPLSGQSEAKVSVIPGEPLKEQRSPPCENSPCLPCVLSQPRVSTCCEVTYPLPSPTSEGPRPSYDSPVALFYPCSSL